MRYLFEDFTFDTERRELHRGRDAVSITPQVFDLLDYLIRNRERVVSKDDLISAVWSRRIVSDAALTTRLNAARHAIGDSGEAQRLLKTLPRKGFRFVGTVQEVQRRPVVASAISDPGEQSLADIARPGSSDEIGLRTHDGDTKSVPLPAPRLSIVVLPFANVGGDPEQDYFANGVTESLITDLSRMGRAFLIARNSAFSYRGKAVDVRQIGRELNVRYVLEGSVQRSGKLLRVNVQLIDVESGKHLWAERFDKPVADLFEMQDEIVSRLADQLGHQLVVAEARRAERLLHPDALDLVFQGFACSYKGPTAEHLVKARDFFERALAVDLRSVGALVGMASVDLTMITNLLADDRAALLSAVETTAITALSLAPDHAVAHSILGTVYILTNRAALGIAECEQALTLNRNLAAARSAIGLATYFMGQAAETEGHVLEALRLSPRDFSAYRWMNVVGLAKLQLGADAEAVDWFRRSIEANRNYSVAHFWLAAALGLLGALDEARISTKAGLALNPSFTIRRLRAVAKSSDNPIFLASLERLSKGMRLAEVPAG